MPPRPQINLDAPSTVAVIDVGSNTLKLLVTAAGKEPVVLYQKVLETRISRGIGGRRPRLSQSGIEAGLRGIEELLEEAADFRPESVSIAATSAVRDAENGEDFADLVLERTNVRMRILSGEDEAHIVGIGLRQDPSLKKGEEFCFLDIGGGSAEIVHYRQDNIAQMASLPLGAVRLTEKFVSDPKRPLPTDEAGAIAEYTERVLRESPLEFDERKLPFVGTGGTFAYTRALIRGCPKSERIWVEA